MNAASAAAAVSVAAALVLALPRRRPAAARLLSGPAHRTLTRSPSPRLGRRRKVAVGRAAAVVEVAYALAAELRAGRPPAAALVSVASTAGPLKAPLQEAALATGSGCSAADELRRIAELPGAGALRQLAAAWDVTERHGGPIADVLDRMAESLDADAAAQRALEAALAGPRATMMLLLALPVFGIVLGETAGADPLALLINRPLGWGLLAAAFILDLLGVLWTRRLLRAATVS